MKFEIRFGGTVDSRFASSYLADQWLCGQTSVVRVVIYRVDKIHNPIHFVK